MENTDLSSMTREQLFQELQSALEGKYGEMNPERACQYNVRALAICVEIGKRNKDNVTINVEIDKSVDKSIDFEPIGQESRGTTFFDFLLVL